jgi:flagellar basal-body rod protein FlgG
MEGMRIASSALKAATTSLDVTSNNLANLNTTGFRSSNAHLTDGPGGRGVEVGAIAESMSPGPVSWTGRSLDLALTGDSFFAVRTSAGRLAFTRDGAMTIDGSGRITTPRGDLLDPGITVPEGATGIAVGRDGAVNASFGDGSSREIGRIQPVRFAISRSRLRLPARAGAPAAARFSPAL